MKRRDMLVVLFSFWTNTLKVTILISTEFLTAIKIKNVTELKTELLCSAIKAKVERGIKQRKGKHKFFKQTCIINQNLSLLMFFLFFLRLLFFNQLLLCQSIQTINWTQLTISKGDLTQFVFFLQSCWKLKFESKSHVK